MALTAFLPKRNWFRRVITVGKLHQLIWILGLTPLLLFWSGLSSTIGVATIAMSVIGTCIHLPALWPYTPLAKKTIADGSRRDLRILSLNVRQKNTDYDRALQAIITADADLVALTETDERWAVGLSSLDERYPHHVKVPLNNTYGMMLYSRHEIITHQVEYLVSKETPSIHAALSVNGRRINIILIHPEPPLDIKRLKDKDLEILKVSLSVEEKESPTVLCGDLNDVGWSYASRHMCEQTELEDPRIGRGFFNTYNAHIPFFRYPIDHFFLNTSLRLSTLKVLNKCGSDHYPVLIDIELPEHLEQSS